MISFENLTILPVLHGRIESAKAIRRILNSGKFDCIAIPLPAMVEEMLVDMVEEIPIIHTLVLNDGEQVALIPSDPCDPFIEAARQSVQLRIPLECLGPDQIAESPKLFTPPDETLIGKLGYDAWAALTIESIKLNNTIAPIDDTIAIIADEVRSLILRYKRPVLLMEIHRIPALIESLKSEPQLVTSEPASLELQMLPINPAHYFFLLGELPFVTGEYEKNRASLFEEDLPVTDMIKRLFLETRDSFTGSKAEKHHFSLTRLQQGITFLRNLTILDHRLTPNMFDMITAAKGIGGDSFALKVLKASNFFPYLPIDYNELDYLSVGLTADGTMMIKMPHNEAIKSINLLEDTAKTWQAISLKPDREVWHNQNSEYRWNMTNLCSHMPEDLFIENFNAHVRGKAIRIMTDAQARTEEFSTSIKDGIDIRETLRNWHTGKIHVKETPRFHGGIDTVVIIFDSNHDEHYPMITTWYAEHHEESTLSFYATDPFSNTIGPGIAECTYGGLSLIFPPRSTPDLEYFAQQNRIDNLPLSSQLTIYSMFYSKEQVIAYIADEAPSAVLKKRAAEMKKHLLWIPLNSFSGETVRKLRKFHMLDGHQVRSWASRFIGE